MHISHIIPSNILVLKDKNLQAADMHGHSHLYLVDGWPHPFVMLIVSVKPCPL